MYRAHITHCTHQRQFFHLVFHSHALRAHFTVYKSNAGHTANVLQRFYNIAYILYWVSDVSSTQLLTRSSNVLRRVGTEQLSVSSTAPKLRCRLQRPRH